MPTRPTHIPEHDAIRGLAALGVVLFYAFPFTFFHGWSFVDLFFVLSGYLITTIILEHAQAPGFMRAFYYRRALRIWPVYYLTLVGVCLANALSRTGFPMDAWLQHATFTQNVQQYWFGTKPLFVSTFGPSWSVAVEEQFYLFWPLALRLFGGRAVVPLALGLLGLGLLGRAIGWHYDMLVSRPDGLALGSVLAIACAEARDVARRQMLRRWFVWGGAAAGAYVLVLSYVFWRNPEPQWKVVTFLAFAVLYACVLGGIILHTGHRRLSVLRFRGLTYLGLISYSLYLTHLPVMTYLPTFLRRFGVTSPSVQVMATWIAIFCVPVVLYVCVERPILRLKDRVPYRAPGSHAPTATASAGVYAQPAGAAAE
ncbi:MAG: acyltransferase [Acidimicrobiia bacterium]|nr:acyltransferase [Acidimicrobiia bacterium]